MGRLQIKPGQKPLNNPQGRETGKEAKIGEKNIDFGRRT